MYGYACKSPCVGVCVHVCLHIRFTMRKQQCLISLSVLSVVLKMHTLIQLHSRTHTPRIHIHLLGKPSASRHTVDSFQWLCCGLSLRSLSVSVNMCVCIFLVQNHCACNTHTFSILFHNNALFTLRLLCTTATRKNRTVELCFSCNIDVVAPVVCQSYKKKSKEQQKKR